MNNIIPNFNPSKTDVFVKDVKYSANGKYIKNITVSYFEKEDAVGYAKSAANYARNPDYPPMTVLLDREQLIALMKEGNHFVTAHPPEFGIERSELLLYTHPEDGNVYIVTRAVFNGRDNLGTLCQVASNSSTNAGG